MLKINVNKQESNNAIKMSVNFKVLCPEVLSANAVNYHTKNIIFLTYGAQFADRVYLPSPRGEDKSPT